MMKRSRVVVAYLSAAVLAPIAGGGATAPQPAIQARSRGVLTVEGRQFRDANGSGTLMVPASAAPEPPPTLAVTIERAGGVPVPQGSMVLSGSSK